MGFQKTSSWLQVDQPMVYGPKHSGFAGLCTAPWEYFRISIGSLRATHSRNTLERQHFG